MHTNENLPNLYLMWDFDAAIGQINSTYPYGYFEESIHEEIKNIEIILEHASIYNIPMIFAITDADSELQELLSGQKGCFVSNTWDAKINVENLNVLTKHSEFKYDRSGDLGLYQRDYLAKFVKEMVE